MALSWVLRECMLRAVLPGGYVNCSIFGKLRQSKLPNSVKSCQSGFKILNDALTKIAEDLKISQSGEISEIRSHWLMVDER